MKTPVLDEAWLLPTKVYAHRQYQCWKNVLAVGIGTKFKRSLSHSRRPERQAGVLCIQFFVSRKKPNIHQRHRLPRFVYRRHRDGRIDHRHRVPTDVIAVGRIHAACAAGDLLRSNGNRGLITLIFRNKAEPGRPFYLISCAHVTGDVQRSPPAYPELVTDGSVADPFARTLVNSTASGNRLEFDIALARIDGGALPVPELRVRDESFALKSVMPARLIQAGTGADAVLESHSARGTVETVHATAAIQYGGGTFEVHNLWGIDVAAARGDSGGLVYSGPQAMGIVVAASPEGWLWFQPLEPAIAFLDSISPVRLSVFDSSSNNP